MNNAQYIFHRNIRRANELIALYDYLSNSINIQGQFDDILRSHIVHSVSAFDKLIHDLVLVGMVRIFENERPATAKYLSEMIAIQHLPSLSTNAIPPPSVRFEEIMRNKLSSLTFQDPPKISEGLSYIWAEEHKWQKISSGLGMKEKQVKIKQKLIVARRNAIVHEADLDPISNEKQPITRSEAHDAASFLLSLGNRIFDLVI